MGMMQYEIISLAKLIVDNRIHNCLMLGVQSMLTTLDKVERGFNVYNIDYNAVKFKQLKMKHEVSVRDVFETLKGVTKIDALDYSDYEGANIVWDLNTPCNNISLIQEYDLVIDGGTLEHIFNVSMAMKNMNSFVRTNGFIYHMLPCAGWVNHGFYSFSPAFFIDLYSKDSGFELIECKLCFKQPKGQSDRLLFSSDCRMLNDKEINLLISDNITSGGVLIECVSKRISSKMTAYEPNQSIYKNNLWCKKKTSHCINEEKLLAIMDKYPAGVYLYGTGDWCNEIINILICKGYYENIEGLFNSDINQAETILRGKRIFYPTKRNLEKASCIIVSTYNYEKEIFEKLVGMKCSCLVIKLSELF